MTYESYLKELFERKSTAHSQVVWCIAIVVSGEWQVFAHFPTFRLPY